MNQELWNKILAFDFNNPNVEYGFSLRLAKENYWTRSYTEKAILEYKKFMYLAASNDVMVSPSEVVDAVWHQHLVFSKSYQVFAELIGKHVQHIPSTHNKNEFHKFKQAKEKTIELYHETFDKMPSDIWEGNSMYDSLNLTKSRIKLRTFLSLGLLLLAISIIPVYFIVEPIYIQTSKEFFFTFLFIIALLIFSFLEFYNRKKIQNVIDEFESDSFIFNLDSSEVIFLRRLNLNDVINGAIGEMIDNGNVTVELKDRLELILSDSKLNEEQQIVAKSLKDAGGKNYYQNIIEVLKRKPIFENVDNSMSAFKKYTMKSKKIGRIFYLNFILLSFLVLLSFERIITGLVHQKFVAYVSIITIALLIVSIVFLSRLTNQINLLIVKNYEGRINNTKQILMTWQWNYFLYGTAALAPFFATIVEVLNRNESQNGNCGSGGCGSGCGGGCGGCGS
jgi:hypothetical protein